ncbi:hypothetical protein SAMN04487926_103343 [Paraburkholderia steynii]|uniref:Uncharacterized protein n=2 Tax=Paraburkholderia TaxID=1822464 RepID=A0A7Z7B2M7_9BURK|nr:MULTISPECIES: hypothetical protein [Paraburkholderia]BCZ80123.1 hypothetical protein PTKU64_37980 [Paraburkholderia terrae]BDC41409.1 hypothetical protein PTKU15_47060 [Paraburkholderia terrae]SDH29447.1 hypothetical protein SAMN04487926_103343 [Paraburkholderia steynii]
MHTAIASSHTLPRRAPAIERSTQAALSLVTIDVTVPGTSSAAGRRALLAALGEGSRLFVMTVDKRNDAITFRVDVMARSVGDVIGALAGVLHRATIGRVRSIALPQHAAQRH